MATDIPVVVTAAGAQPTPPAALLAALITAVSDVVPDYTANLPGSLIEDMSSTEVGGLAMIDSARVELLNSNTPYGANQFMLLQLGQIYIGPGAAPGVPSNTSVYVQFFAEDKNSNPLPGQVIAVGFTVSDGIYEYVVQDGGVTGSDGFSLPLYCLATIAGSWAVPTNSVTEIITSLPSNVTITCSNPTPGVASSVAETEEQWRARVLQAGQAICQGAPTMLKTQLAQIPGVQQRLISVLQQSGGGWEVICGGGDPYFVANAIYMGIGDVSVLVGSSLAVTNITQANPGVVTTALNHGLTTGDLETISGVVGMVPLNGVLVTVTVIDEKNFSIGVNTLGYPAYISGGVVSPNPRNVSVSLNDQPDVYIVPFVSPPQQTVTIAVGWSTTNNNFISQAAVAQLAAPAIAAYVNSITVGAPMSLLLLESTFLAAVASVLPSAQISNLTFAVSINGVSTPPVAKLVFGDMESYFTATTAGIAVSQV